MPATTVSETGAVLLRSAPHHKVHHAEPACVFVRSGLLRAAPNLGAVEPLHRGRVVGTVVAFGMWR